MAVVAGTRRAQAKNTIADKVASMATTRATQGGQPPKFQVMPPSDAPKLPPT
jgi:hypothetical protein